MRNIRKLDESFLYVIISRKIVDRDTARPRSRKQNEEPHQSGDKMDHLLS